MQKHYLNANKQSILIPNLANTHPLQHLRFIQVEALLFPEIDSAAGYLERNLQERTIPTADNMAANPIKTAKSTRRLFIPVAPIRSCLVASLA